MLGHKKSVLIENHKVSKKSNTWNAAGTGLSFGGYQHEKGYEFLKLSAHITEKPPSGYSTLFVSHYTSFMWYIPFGG